MADDSQRPIIIKKIKKGGHGAHGGAWKIAYADFVTAMMAFFLLMWLLSSVSQGASFGISDFFKTPLRIALFGGSSVGDATTPIKGGGEDLSRSTGQLNRSNVTKQDKKSKTKASSAQNNSLNSGQSQSLENLKDQIQEKITSTPQLQELKDQIQLEITPEGLQVQIIDNQNRPMFEVGSANLLPHTKLLLNQIAPILSQVPNRLSISGYTDSLPFGSQNTYSNWELSSDRANAARRQLVQAGLQEDKTLRVNGFADSNLLDKANPLNPINRRVSIVVLNDETTKNILGENSLQ